MIVVPVRFAAFYSALRAKRAAHEFTAVGYTKIDHELAAGLYREALVHGPQASPEIAERNMAAMRGEQ